MAEYRRGRVGACYNFTMNAASRQKLEYAKRRVVPLLRSILSLRGVAVYGSVAQGRARPDSDIDLVVVCQDGFLHLCRWQVNWRLWRAALRGKVQAGVVVTQSALKPATFQFDKDDLYAKRWFEKLKWVYQSTPRSTPGVLGRGLNLLAKLFFAFRSQLDRLGRYPAPHIKFSDQVFFHFGNSVASKRLNLLK